MGLQVVVSVPGTTPGGYTRSLNDPVATNAGKAGGTEDAALSAEETKRFFDKLGEVCEIGRGETDPDITYISLRRADGTRTFIYPNAGSTDVTVSATKP